MEKTHTYLLAPQSLATVLKGLDGGQYSGARMWGLSPGEMGEETYPNCQPGLPAMPSSKEPGVTGRVAV